MDLKEKLQKLYQDQIQTIEQAADLKNLNDVRVQLMGKKGPLTEILRGMKNVPNEERPAIGQLANEIRDQFASAIETRKTSLESAKLNQKIAKESIDVTLPGKTINQGTNHILMQMVDDLEDLFIGLGFKIVLGYEVEEDEYNFERLNIPKNHPARDMQDTFYINHEILMRTHMSPDEARELEVHDFSKGPLKMVSPGRVYRRDTDDATHSHQFFQMEGQVIDKNITMADLKGTLEYTLHHVFGADRKVRFRPSYFPFTEPSVEVDVSCFNCDGAGCSVCKYSGWIEVLGAGMTHPNVLKAAGVDPDVYGGFAFGLGIDRFAILKYDVKDIRSFYSNDVRFLSQFNQGE